jgi:hypothetical protein
MDLGPLVFEQGFGVLEVAEVDLAPVPKSDLLAHDGNSSLVDQWCQKLWKRGRPLHVIQPKVRVVAAKNIGLQAWHQTTPMNSVNAY